MADRVSVRSAEIVPYEIDAVLYVYPGPAKEPILAAAKAQGTAYINEQRRLGRDVRLSAIYAALHVQGVQRVELIKPPVIRIRNVVFDLAGIQTGRPNDNFEFCAVTALRSQFTDYSVTGRKTLLPDNITVDGMTAINVQPTQNATLDAKNIKGINDGLKGKGIKFDFSDGKGGFGGLEKMYAQLEKLEKLNPESLCDQPQENGRAGVRSRRNDGGSNASRGRPASSHESAGSFIPSCN